MRFYIIDNLCAGYGQFMQILCRFCAPFLAAACPNARKYWKTGVLSGVLLWVTGEYAAKTGYKPNGRPGNKRKAAILPFARAENRRNYTSRQQLEAQKS
jgi:hypothetical protein